ncbi:MAG: peptidylprolyl isomerase [Leptolyngbya sp. SIO4C1]|nr:peptidylprolyl isomerase [Leptolyngbya sp. SIO4C1]
MAFLKSSFKVLLIGLLGVGLSLCLGARPGLLGAQPAYAAPLVAYLPPGNAITDGQALLRYALPIDSKEIRDVQGDLEGLSEWLRSKRWGSIKRDTKRVKRTLERKSDKILSAVPDDRQAQAQTFLNELAAGLEPLMTAAEEQDKEAVWTQRAELLDRVTAIEELMVEGFPYEVPETYSDLPQLKGRATVEVVTNKGPVTVVVDGYSAPVTGGNFVDLVKRGFYDGLPFIRAEDFYVLQTGDPEGSEVGFVDPQTQQYRAVPLEVLVKGDEKPIYGETLEALGRYMDDPVLPFSAYGTVAMARPESDPNGGSSQFFFFLFEPELTPAGLNLLDGRYSVFGYVVDGKDVLGKLGQGDYVESVRVVDGLENLVEPAA